MVSELGPPDLSVNSSNVSESCVVLPTGACPSLSTGLSFNCSRSEVKVLTLAARGALTTMGKRRGGNWDLR